MHIDAWANYQREGGARAAKRHAPAEGWRRQEKEEEEADIRSYKELITTIAKLCLSSAQQVRVLKSVSIQVMTVQLDAAPTKRMIEAGKAYTDHMQKLSTTEKLLLPIGLPHHHKYNALLAWGIEVTSNPDGKDKEKLTLQGAVLKEFVAEAMKITDTAVRMASLQNDLKVFIVAKCFKKGSKKIEVSVVHASPTAKVWDVLQELLVSMVKGEVKMGKAPPGNLELMIQKHLDAMGESSSKEDA